MNNGSFLLDFFESLYKGIFKSLKLYLLWGINSDSGVGTTYFWLEMISDVCSCIYVLFDYSIRDKEQELRRVVQELQQRVKDKCRTLYLQLKEEINGQCTQLTDQENMLDTHIHAIDEVNG